MCPCIRQNVRQGWERMVGGRSLFHFRLISTRINDKSTDPPSVSHSRRVQLPPPFSCPRAEKHPLGLTGNATANWRLHHVNCPT
ncbi:hypothetical protein XELAEV_18035778mg [Xenopus laevis]|uniref:Uncharacterized protein n=1 Tax=Xenopus laevis TaxID=8355 RepID=A0A974HCU3_XENLA|nr:hypothetical protein XELAEV_18035778mg [Xenopus laevis]